MKRAAMEKIDPLPDHLRLWRFDVGQRVQFHGRRYVVLRRTTLASGEPAVVLQGDGEQFMVSASQFFAGLPNKAGA